MIHCDDLDRVMRQQMDLNDRSIEEGIDYIDSYIRNMDICPDCFMTIMAAYTEAACEAIVTGGSPLGVISGVFVRAFGVGHVIGRTQAVTA